MGDKAQNIIFYCMVVIVGVLLLSWFNAAQDDTVKVLLYPHAKITEIFYNIPLVYREGVGYSSIDGTFAIGRGCMGSRFMMIMFGMTACMFGSYFKGVKKGAWLVISLIGSVFIGILISIIRIIGSVPFVSHPKFVFFHASIGISIYFLALALGQVLLNKIVRSGKNEENI